MSVTQYKIYKKQVFDLTKTLVIKLDELSVAMNKELELNGYSLYDANIRDQFPGVPDEAFFKYYTNLAGQYHISDIEKLNKQYGHGFMQIQIVANSGMKTLDFTRELLLRNPAIANEYKYGSYYYNLLVAKYPEFETLIMGILYPVNLEIAVQAKNGQILHCGGYTRSYISENKEIGYVFSEESLINSRVEPQELNFIYELQTFIDKYIFRWTNKDYVLTDDLYSAASLALLYMHLPQAIFNIRLANCNTPYAHSFHVKQYLESHGYLGSVVDNIPLESSLWLYKNMRYYESNFGKEFTMRDVVKNVFTPANIPLSGFDTIHNTGKMPDRLLAEAELVREEINFKSLASTNSRKNIDIILDEAKLKARENERELPYALERIQETIEYCGDDTLSTKILQSEMLSLPGKYPFTLTSVLLNLWLYTVEESDTTNKGCDAPIFVTNPLTGTRMSMTISNAYKVVLYCINKAMYKKDILRPPSEDVLIARCIPRATTFKPSVAHKLKPTLASLWSITNHCIPKEVVDIYSTREPVRFFTSADALNNEGTEIFLEMVRQFNVYTACTELHARAQLEYCMNMQYWSNIKCKLTIDNDYPIWLEQIGVNIQGLNEVNLLTLSFDIIEACTGLDLSLNKKHADSQKAAMDILRHFTSYTVLTLEKVSYDKGLPTDMKVLRLANFISQYKQSNIGKMHTTLNYGLSAKQRVRTVFEEFGRGKIIVHGGQEKFKVSVDAKAVDYTIGKPHFKVTIPVSIVSVNNAKFTVPDYYSDEIPPAAVTEVTDLVYYKSDTYPDPKE